MNVDLDPFLLVDPPEGGAELVAEALAANTFDLNRLKAPISSDPDHRILVKWVPLDGGALGRWTQYYNELLLDQWTWNSNPTMTKYVFTHELFHGVDYLLLNNMKRRDLMALMFADASHGPLGHVQPETWKGTYSTSYWDRIHEAWADVGTATYAPTLIYPLFPNGSRYSHRCNDATAVKAIMDRSDTMPSEQWAGASRYETAQITSMNRYPQMPTPVVAYIAADGTPDAQSAAAAAGGMLNGVPGTFLLHPSGQTTAQSNTLAEITRLKPTKIVYVGGTTPIPQSARNAYDAAGQP